MARRIIAVVSQSPSSSPHQRHLEEELVAALMMAEGIDLNVIPHLEHLALDSTGVLCLEGITGDLVLLCWLEPPAALAALRTAGIDGRLAATRFWQPPPGDAAAAQPGSAQRAIYCLDLRGYEHFAPLLAEVLRIRDDSRVQTIEILSLLSPPCPAVATPRPQSSPATPRAAVAPIALSPPSPSVVPRHVDDDDGRLESLVAELDLLDL